MSVKNHRVIHVPMEEKKLEICKIKSLCLQFTYCLLAKCVESYCSYLSIESLFFERVLLNLYEHTAVVIKIMIQCF